MFFNSGRALTSLGQGCRTAAVVLALSGNMTLVVNAESDQGIGGNGFSPTGSSNQVGKQSLFSKTGQAFNKSASKLSRGVKSAFKKKSTGDETTPSESFGNSKKSRDPDPALYVAFARVQEQGRNYAEAASQYEKALEKDPEYLDAILGLANLDLQQGEYELASELYQQAIEIDPRQAAAHNGLALCLAAAQRQAEAIAEFEMAVALAPTSKLFRNNIARELIRGGRGQDAFNHLGTVYDPAVANYNMGFLYNEIGDQKAALFHFQRAVELNPKFPQAQQWYATLSQKYGSPQVAQWPQVPGQTRASQQIVSRQIVKPAPVPTQADFVPSSSRPFARPTRTPTNAGQPGDIVFVPPVPDATPVNTSRINASTSDSVNTLRMEDLPGIATSETVPMAPFSVENVVASPNEFTNTNVDVNVASGQEVSTQSEPAASSDMAPTRPAAPPDSAPHIASRPRNPLTEAPSQNSESAPPRPTKRSVAAPQAEEPPATQSPEPNQGLHWVLPNVKPPVAVKITGMATEAGPDRGASNRGSEHIARRPATADSATESEATQSPAKPTKPVRAYRPPSRY